VLQKFIDGYCRVLNGLMAACLALMVVLVAGNVFMRYALNSGITLSEELSRWLFVWTIFMGAIVALKEHGHLGTDMLVGKLGPAGKKVCFALSHGLMLWICGLLFKGSYEQAIINWESTSAVMEVSLSWLYVPGMLFAVLGGLIILTELLRLFAGDLDDNELVTIQESEETAHDKA
jgi:TRAP-type C4-dicarboxylate transport system permease small subunit